MKNKIYALGLFVLTTTPAFAADFVCNGVYANKGAKAELHMSGGKYLWKEFDQQHVVTTVCGGILGQSDAKWTYGNGKPTSDAENPTHKYCGYYSPPRFALSIFSEGKGLVSAYAMDGGHPGDYTSYYFFCNTKTK